MGAKQDNTRLAVMIDADNAQASLVSELMSEVSRYGSATIKRAYGDWTTPNLAKWKSVLHAHAIQPVQQFRYTTGKNATDSALIIDAMDVLHAGAVDGFCLVSSDSDFTRLATRIREDGLVVYGFGERKTPDQFVAACDKFIYTEILKPQAVAEEEELPQPKPKAKKVGATAAAAIPAKENDQADVAAAPAAEKEKPAQPEDAKPAAAVADIPKLKPMVVQALEVVARDDGWATLSSLGSQLNRTHPSFDPRNYAVSKLGDLMRKQNYLEMKEVPVGDNGQHVQLYVRRKA
ncbi:NYN domain-containing protein [Hydrogenophaga sp. 5NK40-0174]|uniref:NYN domain-containing protein n=1 Tax=Hydrogenophaga sp. 5NK40-0174 TaxID=3127649 RepID=UPI0031054A68